MFFGDHELWNLSVFLRKKRLERLVAYCHIQK